MSYYLNIINKITKNYCDKYPDIGFTFMYDNKTKTFGSKINNYTIQFKEAEKTWKKILTNGSVALGETFTQNLWDGYYKDIPFFLEFMLNILEDKDLTKNISIFNKLIIFIASQKSTTKSIGHTHKTNINSHYSLELILSDVNASNDFFFPILGENYPVYSCGFWKNGASTLEEAQLAKFNLYADKLKLDDSKSLIDLGCGWGAQSLWYAKNLKTNVTLITLSKAQASYIKNQIKKEGLQQKATLKLMDMMDINKLNKQYDAIISLGAIEHIEDFPTLFKKSNDILTPNGKALFHTMFNHVHHDFDKWNSEYMWPGVQIPSRQRLLDALAMNFNNISFEQYTRGSYSKTFRHWLQNFVENENYLLKILNNANPNGNNKKFMRRFKYYLMCCCAVYNVYMDVGYALCDNKCIPKE